LPGKTPARTDATTKASAFWPSVCVMRGFGAQAARCCSAPKATATSTTLSASKFVPSPPPAFILHLRVKYRYLQALIAAADISSALRQPPRTLARAGNALARQHGCPLQATCLPASAIAKMAGQARTVGRLLVLAQTTSRTLTASAKSIARDTARARREACATATGSLASHSSVVLTATPYSALTIVATAPERMAIPSYLIGENVS
jgi:hypothetical protein